MRTLCTSSEVVNGGDGVRFETERAGATVPAVVIRYRDTARAWVNQCPHVGVELDWLPGRVFDDSGLYLVCAMHGALFLPESGLCIAGPCKGKSLKTVPILERDGFVFLKQDERHGG